MAATQQALRALAIVTPLVVAHAACTPTSFDSSRNNVAARKQPLTDTDNDQMDDDWETLYFGGLSRDGTGDFDADDLTDLEEYEFQFDPTVDDAFADADGDRYPNIFELRNTADPNDEMSAPDPTYVVDWNGGGTHLTVSAALSAADPQNGDYQIIAISPGAYDGSSNATVSFEYWNHPKLLVIGTAGAVQTVIEGNGSGMWSVNSTVVLSGLKFHRMDRALSVSASSPHRVWLVDLIVAENHAQSGASALYSTSLVHVSGSTFINNTSTSAWVQQIENGWGSALELVNTVVWSSASGTTLYSSGFSSLSATHSLVKGVTLSGTGNLAGSTDPLLRFDARLRVGSPLRGEGVGGALSLLDMDLETRSSTAPDIGADQWIDVDSDDLADAWEWEQASNLTTLTSLTQDADSDGLTNGEEYELGTGATVVDTDGDGLSDYAEVETHGTNPLRTDTEGDDMPDGWETTNGLNAVVADSFLDADGDRYPNVFEYVGSTDPQDIESLPSPTYVVNGSGGGTHLSIGAALSAANITNGAYQIIAISPGTYSGTNNTGLSISSGKPTLLMIGTAGAGQTIIEGNLTQPGLTIYTQAVVASLTFRRLAGAVAVLNVVSGQVLLSDLVARNCIAPYGGGALSGGGNTALIRVVGSTFIDNLKTAGAANQIEMQTNSPLELVDTLVWGRASGVSLYPESVTVTASHSLVKGADLSGTGNLDGDVDPRIRVDLKLKSDSPLRGAGAGAQYSRLDQHLELRPASSSDIGVDQWFDSDTDGLPDRWEVEIAGNLTTMCDSCDLDGDLLDDLGEYDHETDPQSSDSDGDGITDGLEITLGTNPAFADADEVGVDVNGDGVIESVGLQLDFNIGALDTDGDGVSNVDELVNGTDPTRADTDGDGVSDDNDPFPLDASLTSLPSNSSDTTPPVITLTAPPYAIPL